jgi:hypothetical protein
MMLAMVFLVSTDFIRQVILLLDYDTYLSASAAAGEGQRVEGAMATLALR